MMKCDGMTNVACGNDATIVLADIHGNAVANCCAAHRDFWERQNLSLGWLRELVPLSACAVGEFVQTPAPDCESVTVARQGRRRAVVLRMMFAGGVHDREELWSASEVVLRPPTGIRGSRR